MSVYVRDAGRGDYLPVRVGSRCEQRKTDKSTKLCRWAHVHFLKCSTGVQCTIRQTAMLGNRLLLSVAARSGVYVCESVCGPVHQFIWTRIDAM